MADTPNPKDLESRTRRMLSVTEEARKQALQRLTEDAQAEEKTLLRIRQKLEKRLGPDDPRLRALDRRVQGSRTVIDFVRGGEESGTGTSPADWVVMGRVLDANEQPIADALVTLASDDQDLVRGFGETRTGDDGRFEVRRAGKDFADIFARAPKARVIVTSPDGKLTHTTHEIQPVGDQIHTFDIRLRPEKPSKRPGKRGKTQKGFKKPAE